MCVCPFLFGGQGEVGGMPSASCGTWCPLRSQGCVVSPGHLGDGESGCASLIVTRPGLPLKCHPPHQGLCAAPAKSMVSRIWEKPCSIHPALRACGFWGPAPSKVQPCHRRLRKVLRKLAVCDANIEKRHNGTCPSTCCPQTAIAVTALPCSKGPCCPLFLNVAG